MDQEKVIENPNQISNAKLKVAIGYIKKNLHRSDLSILEVANVINVSERTFFRITREATGCTPYQLIKNIRLSQANDLLAQSLKPNVKRVAASVGYRRVDHFIKLYKQKFAVHPAANC